MDSHTLVLFFCRFGYKVVLGVVDTNFRPITGKPFGEFPVVGERLPLVRLDRYLYLFVFVHVVLVSIELIRELIWLIKLRGQFVCEMMIYNFKEIALQFFFIITFFN